jgi:uncharacterized damage-inducible protein DinB
MSLLRKQYELLRGSRMVMLDFIERELPDHFAEPVAAFNGSNVRYLLVHTANTYKHWLGNFAMRADLVFTDEKEIKDMLAARAIYIEVDRVVYDFLDKFEGALDQPVINHLRGQELALAPLQLFTHVLTHEFHHKGQVMTMCRLLGHTPPDSDIIRN